MSVPAGSNKNKGCLASLFDFLPPRPKQQGIKVESFPSDQPEDSSQSEESFPFRLRDDFLTPAEHSFYLVLKGMMGEYFTICPKISLAEIFFVTRPNENLSAYNKINRKHVDFLICDPKKMTPVFAIELDDRSHALADRVERDGFVEQVFEKASLPLIRVPVRASYHTNELGVLFRQAIKPGNQPAEKVDTVSKVAPPSVEPATMDAQLPSCPKCGAPMALRTASRGPNVGQKFWGCTNYPHCKEIILIGK